MYKIYLIYAETDGIGQWKIGITTNLDKRIQILRVGNPNIIGAFAEYEIKNREIAYKVETLMKKHFKEYQLVGEWFAHQALNKKVFLEMCERYEANAKVWYQYKQNINNYKNNIYDK